MIQQKYLWSFLAVMMATTMGVGLISCGDDDEMASSSKLSKEAEQFLGLWRGNDDPFVILFQTKGKVIYHDNKNPNATYSWKYNESTHVLSTTIPHSNGKPRQWMISSLTNENWSGVTLFQQDSIYVQKKYNYNRCTNDNRYGLRALLNAIFVSRKWVSKSGEEMVFSKKRKDENWFSSNLTGDIYPEVEQIDSNSIYVKDYNPYYPNSNSYYSFIIHNPSDYDNIYITFTFHRNIFADFTDDYYPSDN